MVAGSLGSFGTCNADPLISLGDPVIGIDEDVSSNSSYPAGESPSLIIDGSTTTKYLNFGKVNSGFIITPANGPAVARSFTLTSANDSEARDPTEVTIFGTNEAVVSTDNSGGNLENWFLIAKVPVSLSSNRGETIPPVDFANETSFASFKVVFTKLKGPGPGFGTPNSVQVAEMQMWDGAGGTGAEIFAPGDPILAIHGASAESSSPTAEGPANLFDGDTSTKYLNFGIENSGFIVTPSSGPSVATSFKLSTANDFPERDPVDWELFGTNEPIASPADSDGKGENWTSIATGSLNLPVDRFADGPEVSFTNSAVYTSYKFLVRSIRDVNGGSADSTQYSEFQLFSGGSGGEIRITSISRNPATNQVILDWEAPANGTYTLQISADLADWSSVVASDLTVEANSTYTFTTDLEKSFVRIIPTPQL